MEEPSKQYDAAIGGTVNIDHDINTITFTEARKAEVCQMLQNMTTASRQRKLIHQELPLHMRRRSATHNVSRLPRRFRLAHISQFSKSGQPDKKKRPSRKYRRKANCLQQEYARRSRTFVWLETHIWHARRFHMVPRWGYKIAQRSCNKGYRSSYRATSRHCLVHDLSYEGCVEVCGDEETLKEGFRRLCSEKVGLTLAAKAFTAGHRAGYVWLYEDGAYPYRCLGRVRFLWRSEVKNTGGRRTVWIFAHPTFYRKLVEQLVIVFKLANESRQTGTDIKDITQNPASIRFPRYSTTANGGVVVTELKDTINRFNLTGPLSQAILSKALRVYQPPEKESSSYKNWFTTYDKTTSSCKAMLDQQSTYWAATKDIISPGELSPGEVIALLVEDPRINRPKKRTKALPPSIPPRYDFTTEQDITARGPLCSASPLWDEPLRSRITKEMKTMHEINQMRSVETLVPGERCASEQLLQPIPIVLLQNPGSQDANYKRLGYGSGWDLLVPAGYGLPMWHSLILWGAKAAGQLEYNMISLESGRDQQCVPDTELGRAEGDRVHAEAVRRYFNLPNNKRINYTKLSIASPLRCPWSQLVQEWSPRKAHSSTDVQYFVLREQDALCKLKLALERRFNIHSIGLPPDALIPLLVTMKARGNPGDNALICLPMREDLRANRVNRQSKQRGPVYTEPLRPDPRALERKKLRTEHLRTLKRLRSRRVRDKKRRQRANPGALVRIAKAQNRVLIEEQLRRMVDLWIPARPDTVRNQCTRECFGYITQCTFSLTEGNVNAIGYVTVKGFEKLFKICSKGTPKVLVRGTKSRSYRFASIRMLPHV